MATRSENYRRFPALLLAFVIVFVIHANAQFSSGSTGADGALDYSTFPVGSTVVFDPSKFDITTHPLGQNVYNFTTINIPSGVTVILSGQLLNAPVYWLAQGDVHIGGTIVLKGQDGPPASINPLRVPSFPGPGGFSGGIGGIGLGIGTNQNTPAQPGAGPAGGAAGVGNANISGNGHGGGFTGNPLFAPAIGGSGGGGGFCAATIGPVGGAGGGALILASSTSIFFNSGSIIATGGSGSDNCNGASGGGAGGAVELVANSISGQGSITANGGDAPNAPAGPGSPGGAGAIRLEAFNISASINTDIPMTQSQPGALFIPSQPVSIQVISVAGINLPVRPSGTFQNPDVVINSNSPVTIALQTAGIPPGTVLNLNIYSEDGSTQTVQTTALQGTLQLATATASVTFPPDLSLGYLSATWTAQ